jgi:Flp pilus assembly protein TadG
VMNRRAGSEDVSVEAGSTRTQVGRSLPGRRKAKRIRRAGLPNLLRGNESCLGQAIIEIALVLMTFFVLSFGIIDYSWLMFTQMNIQDAVREAGRYASTGNHVITGGVTQSRILSITDVLDGAAIASNVKNCTVSVNSAAGGLGNGGGPGDTVTVSAVCLIPPMMGLGLGLKNNRFKFTASSSFVNEPFAPSQQY